MPSAKCILVAGLLGSFLLACGDATSPVTEVNDAALAPAVVRRGQSAAEHHAISMKSGAPQLATTHASFWAVQGRTTGLVIQYRRSRDEDAEDSFLEFTVPRQAQLVDPTGRRLARGDSIRIEVEVVPGQLAARFSPGGLTFTGRVPARLTMDYRYGDLSDHSARRLAIWYQPCDGSAWEMQRSRTDRKRGFVVGEISHFSNYAVAY